MSNQTIDNILSQIKLCSKILYKLNLRQVSGDLDYFIDWFNSKYWKHYGHDLHLGPHPAGNNTIDAYSNNCPIPYIRLLNYVTDDQIRSTAIALLTDAYDQFSLLKGLIDNDNEIIAISSFISYLHDVIVYNGGDPGPEPGPDPELDELTLEFYLKTNDNIPQEIHFNANDHWYSIIESQEDANKLTAFGHDINTTGGYLGYDFDYQYGCLSYQPDKFKYEVLDILDVNGNHVEDAGNVNDNLYTAFNTSHNILSIYSKDIPIYNLCYAWKIKITKKEITPDLTDYTRKPITFKIISSGSICFETQGSIGSFNVEYCVNKSDWFQYTVKNPGTEIELSAGDEISWRCPYGNHPTGKNYNNYVRFRTTADVTLCGNIASTRMHNNYEVPWYNNRLSSSVEHAFNRMFAGCSGYIDASNLYIPMPGPDEYYQNSCMNYCSDMFSGCIGLVKAPDLSHLNISGRYLFGNMFLNCANLMYPPISIKAKYAGYHMCDSMFKGCKALTKSPKIMIERYDTSNSSEGLLLQMFQGCTSLSEVYCYTPYKENCDCATDWLKDVNATGAIYLTNSSSWPTNTTSGIPTGWSSTDEPDVNCLCFVNVNSTNSTIILNKIGSLYTNYETSTDGVTWSTYTMGSVITLAHNGDKVYFRGTKSESTTVTNYVQFAMTGLIAAYGNVNSLLTKIEYENVKIPNYGFVHLFEGCSSLTRAPKLSSLYVGTQGCAEMFKLCTSLNTPPVLPAKYLGEECYGGMFAECLSLTESPELPATSLSPRCYQWMFYGCTSLTKVLDLPATTLITDCYRHMFENCSNLNEISCSASDISAYGCVDTWLSNVSNSGVFYANETTSWSNGIHGIPNNWTRRVSCKSVDVNCLCLTNISDSESIVALNKHGSVFTDYEISSDGINWTVYTMGNQIHLINKYDKVYFRGTKGPTDNDQTSESSRRWINFTMTGLISVSGNANSLLKKIGYEDMDLPNNAFFELFNDCSSLIDASNLLLPSKPCYYSYARMFKYCSSLKNAPKLPHKNLSGADLCYADMFGFCLSLTEPPELPATILANACYSGMFYQSGITVAPKLPSESLFNGCYQWMFVGCSFDKAPELLANDLPSYCYQHMFENCSNVKEIKCYAKTFGTNSTSDWMLNARNTGMFYTHPNSTWSYGSSGILNNWIVPNVGFSFERIYQHNNTVQLPKSKVSIFKFNTSNIYTSYDNYSIINLITNTGEYVDLTDVTIISDNGNLKVVNNKSVPIYWNKIEFSNRLLTDDQKVFLVFNYGPVNVINKD